MEPVSHAEFEAVRTSMLRTVGRMTSRDAEGFLIDLDNALDSEAGLEALKVTWRGGADALFTAKGRFPGRADEAAARILGCLDAVAYGPTQGIATATVDETLVQVSFATWSPNVGLATVRIDATIHAPDGEAPAP